MPAVPAFVAAAVLSGDAARSLHDFFVARLDQAADVVRRAVERGGLRAHTDAGDVVRMAVAPIYYRLFITGSR